MTRLWILFNMLWLTAITFVAYAWWILARQQALIRRLNRRLTQIEKNLTTSKKANVSSHFETKSTEPHPETIITIDKNEPLSKYETVNLPDEANINFIDR